jgi:lambda family phage portal protein
MLMGEARDMARTNPYGKSALRAQVDAIIGADFKLVMAPDADGLGVTPEEASAWCEVVEQKWSESAYSTDYHMDAQRKQTFTGLMRTAYSCFYVSGETLATIEWRAALNGNRTCLNLIDSERLSNPRESYGFEGKKRMGVERDKFGAPLSYSIRETHPNDTFISGYGDNYKWRKVPRYSRWGRLNVIHFFDQDRPDMTRGITSFTTALLPMRLLQDYTTTELESASIRATYAAVIESKLDYETAMKTIGADEQAMIGGNPMLDMQLRMMKDRHQYYDASGFKFGKSKVAHLMPDESLKMVQGTQSASALKDFNETNLATIAAALGVDFSTLTKNFTKVNYSGARAALFDVWRSYEVRRRAFCDGVALPFFAAWLEEQIALRGTVPMLGNKNFYDVKDAICKATFETWSKPRLDPQKEVAADQLSYAMGTMSIKDMCAQDGRDWKKVLQQRALEKAEMKKLGLTPEDINPELIMNAGARDGAKPKPGGSDSASGDK